MLYALTNDRKEIIKFPISATEVRAIYPEVSLPPDPWDFVDLTHLNVVNVAPTATVDMPVLEAGMKYRLDAAVWNEDGTKLLRVYSQVPATPENDG